MDAYVHIDKATLAAVPSFGKDAWPSVDHRWGAVLYAFYGQRPYGDVMPAMVSATVQRRKRDKSTATLTLKEGEFPEGMVEEQDAFVHMPGLHRSADGTLHNIPKMHDPQSRIK